MLTRYSFSTRHRLHMSVGLLLRLCLRKDYFHCFPHCLHQLNEYQANKPLHRFGLSFFWDRLVYTKIYLKSDQHLCLECLRFKQPCVVGWGLPWCLSQIPNLGFPQRDVCYKIIKTSGEPMTNSEIWLCKNWTNEWNTMKSSSSTPGSVSLDQLMVKVGPTPLTTAAD